MAASQKRSIQATDLYKFELISGTRISPDGKTVIYAQHRVDAKTEKKFANLWIVSTQGGKPHQFTYGDQSDTSPIWSPDGSQIAFLSNRADKEKPAQIYLIPFTGGEARPLTQIAGSINYLSWSPDGKRILCQVRKTDSEVLEREKDEQKKKLGVVSRHYDRLYYKLDGYGYLPHERWHIWMVEASSGKARQLTDHAVWDDNQPAWSPDGQTIAFFSNRTPDPDSEPDKIDLFLLPIRGAEPKKIPTPAGSKVDPSFSPDGKWIAYYGSEGEGLHYKNMSLWIVPTDGSSVPKNLTEKYDLHCSAWTINDLGQPETMPPTWSTDGKEIYFPVVYHGSSVVKSIDQDGNNLQSVIGEGGVVNGCSLSQSQPQMAYSYGKMDDPNQVYVMDLKTGQPTCLTQLNRWLQDVDLGKIKEVWFKGPDGNDLQGWVLTPPGFDPSKKYPSIMEIHGGPLTQYGNYFMHEFYYLAAGGYVVYFCNPRGGRGYGEAHAGAIWGDWGKNDYADLMAWADVLEKEPYIDRNKMGITGGSYGGYMTIWVVGHTQRFEAAVTQRCVSNFVSMWGSSDFNWSFQYELSNKPPFEDLQFYWDHSPIAYIGNCKTPMKVIHNENDHRCPIEQGEQVFVALKRLGIDTEFVRFPEEFHGLSRNGRTDRRIVRLGHIRGWFDKYLL